MTASQMLTADPKAFARHTRRRRQGTNVAFRRADGRLDCWSFPTLDRAEAFAAVHNGKLV